MYRETKQVPGVIDRLHWCHWALVSLTDCTGVALTAGTGVLFHGITHYQCWNCASIEVAIIAWTSSKVMVMVLVIESIDTWIVSFWALVSWRGGNPCCAIWPHNLQEYFTHSIRVIQYIFYLVHQLIHSHCALHHLLSYPHLPLHSCYHFLETALVVVKMGHCHHYFDLVKFLKTVPVVVANMEHCRFELVHS